MRHLSQLLFCFYKINKIINMSGVRVYYEWFAGTFSNLLAAGIMEDCDIGLTKGWKDGKKVSEKEEGIEKKIIHFLGK